ncbi:MAG TPA: response regulator transcription factor [Candidatus Angelobacter sp.]|nr:response regulator transcription factor [Candidatus Angelobacter sp.]
MIRIVIADDQRMFLGALSTLLELEEDMQVVGKAKNGEEALVLVKQFAPDVCIMDMEMPLKSGLDVAEDLKNESCKLIILTTFARPGYFERARDAGVSGYLLKDRPSEELVNSIRFILEGQRFYAQELVDMVIETNESPLFKREEVLNLSS